MWKRLDLEIHYFVRRKTFSGWEIQPRCIGDHELVYVLQGEGTICIDGVAHRVCAGELIYFSPGILHSLETPEEPCMEFYAVHLGLPEQTARLPFPEVLPVRGTRIESLFRGLELARRQKSELSVWRQNLALEQIICEGMQLLEAQRAPYDTTRIDRVLDYIHRDPCRPLPMEELLERAGLQKSAFLQSFRNVTGTTPLQYIQGLRLEYACDLLSQTGLPVAKVAELSGFTDSFYFSRCFRKRLGVSPSQWRGL